MPDRRICGLSQPGGVGDCAQTVARRQHRPQFLDRVTEDPRQVRLTGLGDPAREGVPVRDIAGVIGRHLNLPVSSLPAEDFGFLGHILAVDQPASSALTGQLLLWRPVHPGLLEDLDKGHYFR